MSKRYKELQEKMASIRKNMHEEANKYFKEESQQLFDRHPKLESFGWTQYTPYFNDGEACEFSTYTDEPNINDEKGWDISYKKCQPKDYKGQANPDYDAEFAKMYNDVKDFLSIFEDADLEEMYGDHVEITVTREGVTTDEYSHD